jgi:hypothetical protein
VFIDTELLNSFEAWAVKWSLPAIQRTDLADVDKKVKGLGFKQLATP